MTLKIREAVAADAPLILDFIRQLAEYERAADQVVCSEADIVRDGFGSQPLFHCLVAETNEQPVGFALYFYKWSTWTGKPTLHLEDLFVPPTQRGKGVGFGLLQRLAQIAIEEDCPRFEWDVLDWNMLARDFYHRLGAVAKDGWLTYRIEGGPLANLATTGADPAEI